MLLDPPNLTGWVNVPLRQMLVDRLGLPVTLEHDAKAAALGEYHYGAGRGERDMVYIVVGTGVGSALILDGKVHRGRNNSAGEVGHITIRTTGDVCSCGNVGCVESFTAGPAIARTYRRALAAAGDPRAGGVESKRSRQRILSSAPAAARRWRCKSWRMPAKRWAQPSPPWP